MKQEATYTNKNYAGNSRAHACKAQQAHDYELTPHHWKHKRKCAYDHQNYAPCHHAFFSKIKSCDKLRQ